MTLFIEFAMALAAIYAGCLLVVFVALGFAPEGYEDENGFHYGREGGSSWDA